MAASRRLSLSTSLKFPLRLFPACAITMAAAGKRSFDEKLAKLHHGGGVAPLSSYVTNYCQHRHVWKTGLRYQLPTTNVHSHIASANFATPRSRIYHKNPNSIVDPFHVCNLRGMPIRV
jgi:hypothetical protein